MTRFEILVDLGCLICGRPPQIHHLRGLEFGTGVGKKSDDDKTIGLCLLHHTGQNGYHHSPGEFEQKYGSQSELLEKQNRLISQYCERWGIDYPAKCR